jgi:transcription antitermination factor NusG
LGLDIEEQCEPLGCGEAVRITRGVFRDQLGLYAGQTAHERVAILLSLFGGQQKVELAKNDVEAI